MKFAVLSGAYKNAGDFLIVDRSIRLLKYVYPNCEIQTYERRKSLEPYIDDINQCDALIFAGGPAYSCSIYPNAIPLVDNLDRITAKFVAIGLGWYGKNEFNNTIYNHYSFNEETRKLIGRIERDSGLPCRDLMSMRVLKNNGFSNILMTGCPAWYNLDTINSSELRNGINMPFKKICISDPANINNIEQAYTIVKYIKDKYPTAQIYFVFHRGINKDELTDEYTADQYGMLSSRLNAIGVESRDISYSRDGFDIYNDCDLHIGFRVHAHIYNLSMRNISILIEEDGRGAGVNEALGLFRIPVYRDLGIIPQYTNRFMDKAIRKAARTLYGSENINPYLIQCVDDYLYILESNRYLIMNNAFKIQQEYFKEMINHIKNFLN